MFLRDRSAKRIFSILRQPPSQPAPRVREQMHFARAGFVNGLDGYEPGFLPGGKERDEHFGLDFKMVHLQRQSQQGFHARQSKAALRIRQPLSGQSGKPARHPAICLPAQPRHCPAIFHAVADDERGVGFFGTGKKFGDIIRRVLAVAVEHQYPRETAFGCPLPTCAQRRAFAGIFGEADNFRAGSLRFVRRAVGRAIVHDQDVWQMPLNSGYNRCNMSGFIEARDHRGAPVCPIHSQGMARMRSIHTVRVQVNFDHRAIGGRKDDHADVRVVVGVLQFGRPQLDLPFRALVAVSQPELRGFKREIF